MSNNNPVDDTQPPLPGFDLTDPDSDSRVSRHPDAPADSRTKVPAEFPVYPFI